MIKYILKLWSNNTADFIEAVRLYKEKKIDGVELYNNVKEPLDWQALEGLKAAKVVGIHNPHSHGWHDFFLTEDQWPHWEQTKQLADFFSAQTIVVHPGRTHNQHTFWENIQQIVDSRIHIENMAGLDIDRQPMEFGQTVKDLQGIKKQLPICFDFEKAVKAAAYQQLDYKRLVTESLEVLEPAYFHVSGGVVSDPMDQHLDLWDCDMDIVWIRETFETYATGHDVLLVFETPKTGNGLENYLTNIQYFRTGTR